MARVAQLPAAIGTFIGLKQVRAMPPMALFALSQRISEAVNVTAGNPNVRVHQDRGVDTDHILTVAHHRFPPLILYVPLEFNTYRSVVVKAADASVDLAAREDESAPFAQADDGVQADVIEVAFQCDLPILCCIDFVRRGRWSSKHGIVSV